jgi:malonyl-CoA decarboxylase
VWRWKLASEEMKFTSGGHFLPCERRMRKKWRNSSARCWYDGCSDLMRFGRMASYPSAERATGVESTTGALAPERGAHVEHALALCRHLVSERGDVPGNRLAAGVLASHASFDPTERAAFFDGLAREFSIDPADLKQAASDYLGTQSCATVLALRRAGESPRQELFLRLNAAYGGTGRLVRMRAQLLEGLHDRPSWSLVESDLAQVLKAIFNRGLLEFHQIDWETAAPVLEKLIQYEAVHAIHDWRDMRRRLEADRRCYGLFHPAWPEEPLIFTELALTRGIASAVGSILDPDGPVADTDACDAAIFYSITNCQPGLRGLSFGGFLIGRVLDELRVQLPRLKTFATLSPIPGFRPWLAETARSLEPRSKVASLLSKVNEPGWSRDEKLAASLHNELLPLCAHYLLHVKERTEPADPVARFHLGNGARLRRVNWLSDTSRAGMFRSVGLTANYLYYPTDLAGNSLGYTTDHTIRATRELERLSRLGARLCAAGPESLPISA